MITYAREAYSDMLQAKGAYVKGADANKAYVKRLVRDNSDFDHYGRGLSVCAYDRTQRTALSSICQFSNHVPYPQSMVQAVGLPFPALFKHVASRYSSAKL